MIKTEKISRGDEVLESKRCFLFMSIKPDGEERGYIFSCTVFFWVGWVGKGWAILMNLGRGVNLGTKKCKSGIILIRVSTVS